MKEASLYFYLAEVWQCQGVQIVLLAFLAGLHGRLTAPVCHDIQGQSAHGTHQASCRLARQDRAGSSSCSLEIDRRIDPPTIGMPSTRTLHDAPSCAVYIDFA
eukprot:557176-Pelagomonas_calceolata.AAC.2